MGKKGTRAFKKVASGKTAGVAASGTREVEQSQPIDNRHVTDNPLQYSTLRGKVQNRCKQMPEGKRFQPGQSGNPSGRPSGHRKVIVDTVKELLAEPDARTQKSAFQQLIEQAIMRAKQGSYRHLELLLSYGLGKPLQQQVNVNTEVTRGDRLAGMSDEELTTRLLELTVERYKAAKNEEEEPTVQ